jgi:hypothetical protein
VEIALEIHQVTAKFWNTNTEEMSQHNTDIGKCVLPLRLVGLPNTGGEKPTLQDLPTWFCNALVKQGTSVTALKLERTQPQLGTRGPKPPADVGHFAMKALAAFSSAGHTEKLYYTTIDCLTRKPRV